MRNGIYGFCLLTAVLLVFWLSDGSKPPPPAAIPPAPPPPPAVPEQPAAVEQRFSSGIVVETIDLSRTFEPTGEELTLRLLLEAGEPEELPLPRRAEPELAPLPRIAKDNQGRQKLNGKSILANGNLGAKIRFADAAEEPSARFNAVASLVSLAQYYMAEKGMEMMLSAQPLKGIGFVGDEK